MNTNRVSVGMAAVASMHIARLEQAIQQNPTIAPEELPEYNDAHEARRATALAGLDCEPFLKSEPGQNYLAKLDRAATALRRAMLAESAASEATTCFEHGVTYWVDEEHYTPDMREFIASAKVAHASTEAMVKVARKALANVQAEGKCALNEFQLAGILR